MGGAYSALAEGAEGIPFNAAAASQRYPYSTTRTDYDLTAGITFPSSIERTDFDNNGRVGFGYRNFVFATLGGTLQHDHFGMGTVISVQNYSLGNPSDNPFLGSTTVRGLNIRVFKIDAVASYGFFDDQLHLGGGLRGAFFTASEVGERLLFGTYGLGAQAGALWTPHSWPLRLGGTVRSPVIGSFSATPDVSTDSAGDRLLGRFYLPTGVDLPWEAEWGVAFHLGDRPINIPWIDENYVGGPDVEAERRIRPGGPGEEPSLEPTKLAARRILKRRYRQIARDKVLISFSMLATGPTSRAVGVESMLTQVVDRSGQRATVAIRGGAETELLPNRLQLRVGSYMEPTRFRESSPRVHGTAGFEVRVIEWTLFGLFPEDNSFRISGAVDAARDYFGWSLGIGAWH